MVSAVELWVAGRYLRARRREGFISVIAWFSLVGIALGVATLIIVLSVMNGFREELLARILGLNGHITIQEPKPGKGIAGFDRLVADLDTVEGVTQVTPIIDGQVMAAGSAQARGAVVRGIRKADLLARKIIADNITAGSLDDFEGDDAVVVGERLARRLGLPIGGRVTLISPRGRATVMGTMPRARAYRIVAVFNIGMFEYDSSFVFMPLAHAQRYFMLPDRVNEIEVFVKDPDKALRLGLLLAEITGERGLVYTWQQMHSHFFSALQVERNVMFLILTLIILVAAFNIISSLIMMVHDKGKGIAIMRTMGATRGMIMRIFFLTGASVGVLGTAAGVALGLGFTHNIDSIRRWLESLSGTELWSPEVRFLSQLPAIVDPGEVAAVVLISLVLSFLATLYPARRAARLDPVEALRYE